MPNLPCCTVTVCARELANGIGIKLPRVYNLLKGKLVLLKEYPQFGKFYHNIIIIIILLFHNENALCQTGKGPMHACIVTQSKEREERRRVWGKDYCYLGRGGGDLKLLALAAVS